MWAQRVWVVSPRRRPGTLASEGLPVRAHCQQWGTPLCSEGTAGASALQSHRAARRPFFKVSANVSTGWAAGFSLLVVSAVFLSCVESVFRLLGTEIVRDMRTGSV